MFSNDLSKVINYDNRHPAFEDLQDAGEICCSIGKLNLNDKYGTVNPEHAVQLWDAAFELGRHMYEERLCWDEQFRGHGVMQTAAINLRDYYEGKKDPRSETIAKFIGDENDYQLKITEAFKIIGSIDEGYAGKYAGDILAIASGDKKGLYSAADPMFRVEALKHVGHYIYNSRSKGDQLASHKILARMIDDASLPPNVRTAANAAHDLHVCQAQHGGRQRVNIRESASEPNLHFVRSASADHDPTILDQCQFYIAACRSFCRCVRLLLHHLHVQVSPMRIAG